MREGVVGAALAGGESRRMGAPKEGVLLPDGRPMLDHVLDALRGACGRTVVVGACRGVEIPADTVHVPDLRLGEGPLAGLEVLLSSGLAPRYLVTGCDQPLLSPDLLGRLLAGEGDVSTFFLAEDGTEFDPLPGVFPASLLGDIRAALDRGERSIRRFLRGRPIAWVAIPDAEIPLLRSLNTPEHVAEAVRRWPFYSQTTHNAGKGRCYDQ